jgi:predicted RNA-binding Zn-ribbon protein involved in translation (DUF1610 family)
MLALSRREEMRLLGMLAAGSGPVCGVQRDRTGFSVDSVIPNQLTDGTKSEEIALVELTCGSCGFQVPQFSRRAILRKPELETFEFACPTCGERLPLLHPAREVHEARACEACGNQESQPMNAKAKGTRNEHRTMKTEKPQIPPYNRVIDDQEFVVVFNGSSPLASANQCRSSLQASHLIKKGEPNE